MWRQSCERNESALGSYVDREEDIARRKLSAMLNPMEDGFRALNSDPMGVQNNAFPDDARIEEFHK